MAVKNLSSLSPGIERNRILNSDQASEFWGVSKSHWRRLYRADKVPRPIKIGDRKLGWRACDLILELEARSDLGAPDKKNSRGANHG